MGTPAFGSGYSPFFSAALKGLVAGGDVKTSTRGVLHALDLHNLDASAAFLQIFDATDHTAVTLGTTTPILSIAVPSSGEKDISDLNCGFNSGLVFATTTTANGAAAPATGFVVNATYE